MADSWLRSDDPASQAFAVRTLGRLERPDLVAMLAPMLSARSLEVRSEAANALGQAVQGAPAADRPGAIGETASLLRARLENESEAAVRGVICETLGRLPYPDAASAQAIEKLLVDSTWTGSITGNGARTDAPAMALVGAVKGLEALLRQQTRLLTPAAGTIARLRELAAAQAGDHGKASAQNDDARRIRRLALLALAPHASADERTLARTIEDDQWEVRRITVRLAGAVLRAAAGSAQDASLALIRRGLGDADWRVRYEAVSAFARNQDAPDCPTLISKLNDGNSHVALLAIDQLPRCQAGPAAEASRVLESLVRTLPASSNQDAGAAGALLSWHRAAHALVALARVAPDQAHTELGRFQSSVIWQVRMYAARAAATLQDAGALRELARDKNDNVRNAAVSGLSEVEQHGADDVYIAQLARSDGQLLMTAARALKGSRNDAAVPALLTALAAQSKLGRSTSRDPRLALLERIGELGSGRHAPEIAPLLNDFDPRIAASVSTILAKWGGTGRAAAPPGAQSVPDVLSLNEVRSLEGATAVVRIKNRGTFTLALLPWEAPATAAGFARLVECGYYNGLTFHRIEPNFVIQGGSPGANEYAGYPRFMRDEVGLASNRRGTIGLSTRGRNTGDAQWYINLADNARLDHNYTVFASVVSGMDVVDAILEGDEIAEIRLIKRK